MPESPTLLWRIKLLFLAEMLPKKPHRIVHLPRPPSLASYLVLKQASLLQDSCLCGTSWRRGNSPPVPNLTTSFHSGARLQRYLVTCIASSVELGHSPHTLEKYRRTLSNSALKGQKFPTLASPIRSHLQSS